MSTKDILLIVLGNAGLFTLLGVLFKGHFDKKLADQNGLITKEVEKLKKEVEFDFKNREELLIKKRNVYNDLVDSMSIFIGQRVPKEKQEEYQEKFLKAYDTAWLWASDDVLEELSNYMQLKIEGKTGEDEQQAFAKCVLAMRKDIGFVETKVSIDNYKFIIF
ncbi:hypothetical protein [Bacillus sp. FJAT-52991]|uniref:Uncharacterized protein n=1 Tax=Bacillus kandeliae TaxID=3129297 RepID=A0ABZ2N341_9BACI